MKINDKLDKLEYAKRDKVAILINGVLLKGVLGVSEFDVTRRKSTSNNIIKNTISISCKVPIEDANEYRLLMQGEEFRLVIIPLLEDEEYGDRKEHMGYIASYAKIVSRQIEGLAEMPQGYLSRSNYMTEVTEIEYNELVITNTLVSEETYNGRQ